MSRNTSDLPAEPIPGDEPLNKPAPAADSLAPSSALEVLAAAGDEAARAALGQATGAERLDADRASTGLEVGKPATSTIRTDLQGRIVSGEPAEGEPFRGSILVQEGQVVTDAQRDAVFQAERLTAAQ